MTSFDRLLDCSPIGRSHEPVCNRETLDRGSGVLAQPMIGGSSCFQSTFLAYRSCQLPSSRSHMQALILIVHARADLPTACSYWSSPHASLQKFRPISSPHCGTAAGQSVSSTRMSKSWCLEALPMSTCVLVLAYCITGSHSNS